MLGSANKHSIKER